jgi:DNA-binding transcriptional ArsR family regulator
MEDAQSVTRLAHAAKEMLPHARSAAALLRALANEQRLIVLCNLSAGELSVGELNASLPLSQSALSQHLAVLRESGVVTTRREAQTVYYSLVPGPAAKVVATLHGIYCKAPAARSTARR